VGFVIGSFVGGSRALIFPALLVAIALLITAFVDIPFSGPIGEQHWSPDSRTELEAVDTYDVSMGEGTLDLSELPLLRRDTNVRATVGMGHLVVLVPDDQDLTVNTEVGAGEVMVFGERQNGVGFETHDGFPGDGATLALDLEVGLGQIEVHRVDREETGGAPDPELPR
jgi:predicted membrane protein